MRRVRTIVSASESCSAWPRCRSPVTFGGGCAIAKLSRRRVGVGVVVTLLLPRALPALLDAFGLVQRLHGGQFYGGPVAAPSSGRLGGRGSCERVSTVPRCTSSSRSRGALAILVALRARAVRLSSTRASWSYLSPLSSARRLGRSTRGRRMARRRVVGSSCSRASGRSSPRWVQLRLKATGGPRPLPSRAS